MGQLGLEYTHIPVDFKNPTQADFDAFVAALGEHGATKVWVHCAANMRVSAFMYRYRTQQLGLADEVARADLNKAVASSAWAIKPISWRGAWPLSTTL